MNDFKYILIIGNPVDGLKFEGPFEDFEEAEMHAEFHDDTWWIVNLRNPEEITPTCDICGKPDQVGVAEDGHWLTPDWNGETGNHASCEADAKD